MLSVIPRRLHDYTLLKDVVFEETHDNSMNVEPEENGTTDSGNNGSTDSGNNGSQNSGSQSGSGSQNSGSEQSGSGSQQEQQSTLYEGGFTLSDTTTVKAIAIKNGESSAVSTRLFSKGTGGEPGGNGDME